MKIFNSHRYDKSYEEEKWRLTRAEFSLNNQTMCFNRRLANVYKYIYRPSTGKVRGVTLV